ncbi:MAG: DNA adenine methylase [Proteobacteria bacterium]|nr:DNA adenine methylase [Pseudomonadota bacterium]
MRVYRSDFFYKNISKILSRRRFFSAARTITPLHYFGQRESIVEDLFQLSKVEMPINSFYDPFSGSGSISFAAIEQKKANNFHLNDSLPMLKSFWEWVRINPQSIVEIYSELIEDYYRFPTHQRRNVYEKLLKTLRYQNNVLSKPYFAAIFAFLINFSEKNIPLFDKNLELATRPNVEIDHESKLLKIKNFNDRITHLSHLFQVNKVFFSSGDYHKSIGSAKKGDLIIFDPPYPQQAHNIYYNIKTEIDLRESLSQTFRELNERQVDFMVLYGAGDIPPSVQFRGLGLQHLIRLSCHPLYGEFLEHLYVSSTIPLNSASLPTGIIFYDQLFKPYKDVSSINYDQALYILKLTKKSEQENSVFNEATVPRFK